MRFNGAPEEKWHQFPVWISTLDSNSAHRSHTKLALGPVDSQETAPHIRQRDNSSPVKKLVRSRPHVVNVTLSVGAAEARARANSTRTRTVPGIPRSLNA
jgi:hypothetical protein